MASSQPFLPMKINHSNSYLICFLIVKLSLTGIGLSISHAAEVIDLTPIIISAQRYASRANTVAENVSVLGQGSLDNPYAKQISEVLQNVPGVDISLKSGVLEATTLSIHGSDARHVRLMVDGIPFNTQLSGQANPVRVPLSNIKRIEIIKGGASSVWGSSLGGVINIITKNTGDSAVPRGSFTTMAGEFGTTENSLELSGKIKETGYYFSGSFLKTNGTDIRSSAEAEKFFLKAAHPLNDLIQVNALFGYSGGVSQSGLQVNKQWISAPFISRYGKIELETRDEDNKFSAAYKYNDQYVAGDMWNYTSGDSLVPFTSSRNKDLYQGLSIQKNWRVREEDELLAGADFDWHIFKSSNYLSDSKDIGIKAYYANYTFVKGHWRVIPGSRFDDNQHFGSQFSPSMGLVYDVQDERRSVLRTKVSRAFNAPPLMWIYNADNFFMIRPNPDLKAERALVYEIGGETRFIDKMRIKVDLFRADVQDGIARAIDSDNFSYYANFQKFRRQGVELATTYEVNPRFQITGGAAFTDVINRATGESVRDSGMARQSFLIGLQYKDQNGLSAKVDTFYKRWTSQPSLEPNDRKFIINGRISKIFISPRYKITPEVFLNLYNLTNSKYWSNINDPLPKRYFEGGISINF